MYDINELRREFKENPLKLELLNEFHSQICQNHFGKEVAITLNEKKSKRYGNKLKKEIASCLGYEILNPKPTFTFVIRKVS